MTILLSIAASAAAFVGGAIALRLKDRLHIVLGLSAGAVLGAVLFDIIPEAIELGEGSLAAGDVTALVAVGFFSYLILDRIFSFHAHGESEMHERQSIRGALGAGSFCLHSVIDGIAIGLAFQASAAVGAIVAVAVIAHRFSDGINTVGVILKHRGENRQAVGWLAAVALAPIAGAASTSLFSVSGSTLSVILSVFAGFFLYIGASDLIPEGHHGHSRALTTIMTLLGAGILYAIAAAL